MSDTAPQPPPVPTESEPIYRQVIADIEAKAETGLAKYGTYLQADNGRDHLADAYQEGIDSIKYLKAAIVERRALLARVATSEAERDKMRKQLAAAMDTLSLLAVSENYGTSRKFESTAQVAVFARNTLLTMSNDALADSYAASIERRGVDKVVELACHLACPDCAAGLPIVTVCNGPGMTSMYYHAMIDGGGEVVPGAARSCAAFAIRQAAEAVNNNSGGTK